MKTIVTKICVFHQKILNLKIACQGWSDQTAKATTNEEYGRHLEENVDDYQDCNNDDEEEFLFEGRAYIKMYLSCSTNPSSYVELFGHP